MKQLLLLFFILLATNLAWGQSASQEISRNPDIYSAKENKIELIKGKVNKKKERVLQVKNDVSNLTNSLRTGLEEVQRRTKGRISHEIDSIQLKADNVQRRIAGVSKYTSIVDSLDSISDSLNPIKYAEKAQSKLTEKQSKVNAVLAAPEKEIDEKLGLLSSQANGQGNLPGNFNLPKVNQSLPSNQILAKAPKRFSFLPRLKNPLGKHAPQVNNPLDKLPLSTPKELDALGKVNGLFRLRKDVKSITKLTSIATNYKSKGQNIGEMLKLDAMQAEEKVVAKLPLNDLQAVKQGENQLVNSIQSQVPSNTGLDAYRQQTLAKAKEVAMKKLATQQAQLQESINKLSVYQRQGRTIFTKAKGMPCPNTSTKEKLSLPERFVSGVTLQLQKPAAYWIDLTPSLRYRLLPVLSIGVGWNERIAITEKRRLLPVYRVYGVRSFAEFTFTKGLALRVDAERMNAFVPFNRQQFDIGERKWVWTYMGGVKKEFSFMKGVQGNIQFMYHLRKQNAPYLNRYNVRFGFEFPFKAKEKEANP